MEKKTIGAFIAALRKANGMTQKDLADRLNVSDKTVSRWERDECAPDLSLIPVLAEIFGVTCDELLRGERKAPEDRAETPEAGERTPKGDKQRRRLLKSTLSQYRSWSYIAMGLSVAGLIAALICNLAFTQAALGFLLGAVFFAAGVVCQAVAVNRAFLSVEDAELSGEDCSGFRRSVLRMAERSFGLTAALLGFTFPLLFVDAYMGLGTDSMLLFGAIGAAGFLLIYGVALYFYNGSLVKEGAILLTEQEDRIYWHNHKLKKACVIVLAALLVATLLCHVFLAESWMSLAVSGTTFTDYESFVAYMEQEPEQGNWDNSAAFDTEPLDVYSEEIDEEEAPVVQLNDINGNVVCTYVERNTDVVSVRYGLKEGTVLPITVCTEADYDQALESASVRDGIFVVVYCAEVLGVLVFYFKKRAKPVK